MINTHITTSADSFNFARGISWKYYNKIRKKAMEQEFSWSGLIISLSIAFFVVIMAAYSLNSVYSYLETGRMSKIFQNSKVYQLKQMEVREILYIDKAESHKVLFSNYWT